MSSSRESFGGERRVLRGIVIPPFAPVVRLVGGAWVRRRALIQGAVRVERTDLDLTQHRRAEAAEGGERVVDLGRGLFEDRLDRLGVEAPEGLRALDRADELVLAEAIRQPGHRAGRGGV